MNLLWKMMFPVAAGFILDLMLGDPRWMYHPVRLIGALISQTEKIIRNLLPRSRKGEKFGGAILVVIVLLFSTIVPWVILNVAYALNLWAGILVESFMCYQILATRSLRDESDKVYLALKNEGLDAGRKAVSMIVGRDTESLSEKGVTKACVETVAENTSDGIIAPLFYMMIGGAVLGWTYKAVNTMDSMIGYKNEKYQYFGTVAAKLDDALNFIPARLAAWFMILASLVTGDDYKNALRIYIRDRHNHKSPNAAQTEAVMAGALDIELAGDAWYFGTLYKKPTIGDPIREIEIQDIRRSHRLLYATCILAVVIMWSVKGILFSIIC